MSADASMPSMRGFACAGAARNDRPWIMIPARGQRLPRRSPVRGVVLGIVATIATMSCPLLARAETMLLAAASSPGHAYMHPPNNPSWMLPKLSEIPVCRDKLRSAIEKGTTEAARVLTNMESFIFGAAGGAAGIFVQTLVRLRV